jgi:hypothetical protein
MKKSGILAVSLLALLLLASPLSAATPSAPSKSLWSPIESKIQSLITDSAAPAAPAVSTPVPAAPAATTAPATTSAPTADTEETAPAETFGTKALNLRQFQCL